MRVSTFFLWKQIAIFLFTSIVLVFPKVCFGSALLEDFSTRRLNGDGGALFDAYYGENSSQTVVYPGVDGAFPLGGKTLQINVGTGTHPMVYMHFFPRSGGYSYPNGYALHYIKNGTWDVNYNRMTFWVKSTTMIPASTSGTFQVGTYIRSHGSSDPNNQGAHYYHLIAGAIPANKWVKIWINRTPQHQVGQSTNTNWGDDPEFSSNGVHYFDGLTRWYFDGAYTGTANTNFQFADVNFSSVSGEPDSEVATVSAAYDGAKYVLGFDGLKNTPRTYNIRYSTNSMKVNGFSSGTSGGTVSNTGDTYTGVSWSSPNMAEAASGMYFAIQPTNGSLFTEVYLENLVSSSTPDLTPPTSPTSLSATSPSQSSITVSWTAATDPTTEGQATSGVTNYQVERCLGLSCSNFTQVGTPTASPFTDTGLTASTGYSYHVRAVDAAGNVSGWSNVVGATTQAPDTTSPSTPTILQASASSSSTIDLTWTASTDNIAVTQYKLERCQGSSCTTFTQIGTPTTNSYSDSGLTASTTYRYQVRATDAANNNSNYSTIATATTPQAPPSPTFVSEYETPWNTSSSPKTTSNFSVQSGDTLVAYAVNEDGGQTLATPPTGTLQGTWTLQQSQTAGSYTGLRLWTMQVSSNQTNVNVSFSNGGNTFGGDVLHFRNTSGIGVTAQANNSTGNPSLTLTNVQENSTIVMVNGDWSAKTGTRTYNTTSAGSFTETSYYADGSSYGVEAGYYANAGAAGNKTIGLTAPTGMKWTIAGVELKGSASSPTFSSCSTVTTPTTWNTINHTGYATPYDLFNSNTLIVQADCTQGSPTILDLSIGNTTDPTLFSLMTGYYWDGSAWQSYTTPTCSGQTAGSWCQGKTTGTITSTSINTANSTTPQYFLGFTCKYTGSLPWKCGCQDTACTTPSWQLQGAGL